MMARWVVIWTAVAAMGGLSGCATSGPNLKTPMPERFALPPVDDARFSEPISYPKDTLNQDTIVKPGAPPKLPSQAPPLTSPTQGGRGAPALGSPGF
jgi:hypothetical protein